MVFRVTRNEHVSSLAARPLWTGWAVHAGRVCVWGVVRFMCFPTCLLERGLPRLLEALFIGVSVLCIGVLLPHAGHFSCRCVLLYRLRCLSIKTSHAVIPRVLPPTSGSTVYVLTPFITGGDLFGQVSEHGKMPKSVVKPLFRQVVEGMRVSEGWIVKQMRGSLGRALMHWYRR